jgi:hypothetical protein
MFNGWIPSEPPPYSYKILDDNSFVVFYDDKEIHHSRIYRLKSQAETGAQDWIQREINAPNVGVTLDVQNASMPVEAIFRSVKNG